MKYEEKYLERLAEVYIDRFNRHGGKSARQWYQDFLDDELRVLVKPHIATKIAEHNKENK